MKACRNLFEKELQNLYSLENQLVKALPSVISTMESACFKNGIYTLLQETDNQIESLKTICNTLEIKLAKTICPDINGFVTELNSLIKKNEKEKLKEMQFIAHIQRLEYYKISGYGMATRSAYRLGYSKIGGLLQAILHKEHNADDKLNKLAIMHIRKEFTS